MSLVKALSLSLDNNSAAGRKTCFVVVTQYYWPGETDTHTGWIRLFKVCDPCLPQPKDVTQGTKAQNGQVGLVTSFAVKGCVLAIAETGGHLVAAIDQFVSQSLA